MKPVLLLDANIVLRFLRQDEPEQSKACVPAVIIEAHGEIPYLIGETFALDEHSHGLVPLSGELNIAIHRATQRALQEGTPRIKQFIVPDGELILLLDPLLPRA